MSERALVGQTLADRYELLELLASGGMGSVYRAHDRELDDVIALKVINAALASQPAMVERFRHEVKLARRVTHVNIARTFELGRAGDIVFCTMELIEGESLRFRLNRDGRLPLAEAASVARELCHGLAAAHAAGVIHRDIKPENVLLALDHRVVLADFGVAAVSVDEHNDELSGTPEYMAPEQARGEPPTPATDIYAVGLVLCEMLTGVRAFTGSTAYVLMTKQEVPQPAIPEDLPRELATVIGRATALEPDHRIASATELASLLAPWSAELPATLRPDREAGHALHTVIVLAPRADGTDARLHIAEGVHEELLCRLVRRPGMRVWPRVEGVAGANTTVVEVRAGDQLAVTIHRPTTQTTLQLPLEVADIALAADAIASAVVEAVARTRDERRSTHQATTQALELLLRARILENRGFRGVEAAIQLLERAHALCPDDPKIAARLAMLYARYVIIRDDAHSGFRHVRPLVEAALAAAPLLSEAHVAAGHLELHTGDSAIAATHFRTAIACSPHVAAAHEGLGRMLVETGFLDVAFERLADAVAISPNLSAGGWEIARAHALEQNWSVYDQIVAGLTHERDRPVSRLRIALWRGDLEATANARAGLFTNVFEPALMALFASAAVDGRWFERREEGLQLVLGSQSPSKRRRAFAGQLIAEAAGHAGDGAACAAMIEYAVDQGLFDLHWLERCPFLELVRDSAAFARCHARVQQRAHAILDALYGDHDASSLTDTVVT